MNKKDIKIFGKTLTVILYLLRWVTLILAVVVVGLTIGLITISSLNNFETVNELVAKLMSMFTYYTKAEVLDFISTLGLRKVSLAGIAYGTAFAVKLICEYVILNGFIKLSKSLTRGDIYTNVNVEVLNRIIPYTIIATFAQPIIIYITHQTTTLFSEMDYDVSDFLYIILALVLKVILDKGYDLKLREEKNRRELSDAKAEQSELRMELIRKESELKELREYKELAETKKTPAKRTVTKKTVKEAKKEETKEEPKKKASVKETVKKVVEKVEEKKATAKKTTTKKVEEKTEEKKTTKKAAAKKVETKKVTAKEEPKKTTTKKVAEKKETKKVAKKEVAPKKETKATTTKKTAAKKTTKK